MPLKLAGAVLSATLFALPAHAAKPAKINLRIRASLPLTRQSVQFVRQRQHPGLRKGTAQAGG